jgi:hypothetical protein
MLLPFFPADPQLVERSKTSEDASAEPRCEPSFGWVSGSMNFQFRLRDEFMLVPMRSLGDKSKPYLNL